MTKVGFHAAHELYSPSELIAQAKQASMAGFVEGMCSDHFHPWLPSQGQSGFAWSWLGAAMASTGMSFGTVNAPGQRYHPAIIAQAAATLAEMFPGRFWLAVGTGEAVNELITGDTWPEKPLRTERLRECVDVMRALWRGETVNFSGRHIRVDNARLYSRPASPPKLFGAAITPDTARWVGSWADGLITVGKEPDEFRETLDAFHAGGGAGKPVFVQAICAYAKNESEALTAAHKNWPIVGLETSQLAQIPTPQQFEQACRGISRQTVQEKVRVSSSLQQHIDWIARDLELGASRVYLQHVGPDMSGFIEAFAAKVLPAFA